MIGTTACVMMVVGQAALPGGQMELGRAYAEAHTIVVAEAKYGGIVGLGAVMFTNMEEWKVSSILKGKAAPKGKMGMAAVGTEEFPERDKVYIFFIKDFEKGHAHVHKVIPKTDENLAAVKALSGRAEVKAGGDKEQGVGCRRAEQGHRQGKSPGGPSL